MAGFIPEDNINEVRNACNIVDVVSQHLSLKKAGRNYLGLCPFHSEKTPSFTVSEEKQIFHCFGCGQGGNVFTFLMLYHQIEFPEAVQMVGQKCGIPVTTKGMSSDQKRRWEGRQRVFKVNQTALEFFQSKLADPALGKAARSYLEKRQIPGEIAEKFFLGYAPPGWRNLVGHFSDKGERLAEVERAGLIIPKSRGHYDRFRERLIFPILDVREKVVGFGGRALDDSLPKYLNSPETPVYHKGKTLYGLCWAKEACRREGTVFVVEGYFDLLALQRCRIENVVATLGTAITREHIRILKGYAKRVVLVFDSDAAGTKAVERSLPLFVEENVEAGVITLPAGKDPDLFICDFGGSQFLELAKQSLPMMAFLLERTIEKHGLSLEGKVKIVEELKRPLQLMDNHVGRAVYTRELAQRLDVNESAILEQVGSSKQQHRKPGKPRHQSVAPGSCKLEEALVGMMLQSPEVIDAFDAKEMVESIQNDDLKCIGKMILDGVSKSPPRAGADLVGQTEDPKIRNLISSLITREESWTRENCFKVVRQYRSYIQRNYARSLSKQIKAAEQANDESLLEKLLTEKQRCVQRKTEGLSY